MKFDFDQAFAFIKAIHGSEDAIVSFRTFDDLKGRKDKRLSKNITGRLNDQLQILKKSSLAGAGVFLQINSNDGQGYGDKNIERVNAFFADKDDGKFTDDILTPNLLTNTKNGQHAYYLLKAEELVTVDKFRHLQQAIIKKYNSDPSIKNPSRVMRLPGFPHLKNPDEPFLVQFTEIKRERYSISELNSFFVANLHEVQKPISSKEKTKGFYDWLKTLPTEEGKENRFGGRNNLILLITREALSKGISEPELISLLKDYCERSDEDFEVALEIFERQKKEHELKPFKSFFTSDKPTAYDLAMEFMREKCQLNGNPILKIIKDDAYSYNNGVYIEKPVRELRVDLISYTQENTHFLPLARSGPIRDAIGHVEAQCKTSIEPNSFARLDDPKNRNYYVILQNGVVEFEFDESSNLITKFEPHSPKYFSTNQLPFAYDPEKKCPTFNAFLQKMLPDEESKAFLREWMGYNLLPITSQGKAVILVGEGANGKSVYATILTEVLGKQNVSAVSIEQLAGSRPFPLANTVGKLANIVEDMNDINKVGEGVLKSFITGGYMTTERKQGHPFEFRPTARLTVATNNLPRFYDTTEGLYRRFVIIPFPIQLPESEQDKNLISPQWWRDSGELPGIFNEALDGLKQLLKRGNFIEPEVSKKEKSNFRSSNNTARDFLQTHYQECTQEHLIFSNDLYLRYKGFCLLNGYPPFGANKFSKEIKRVFKNSVRSGSMRKDPKTKKRGFFWSGIQEIDNGCTDVYLNTLPDLQRKASIAESYSDRDGEWEV